MAGGFEQLEIAYFKFMIFDFGFYIFYGERLGFGGDAEEVILGLHGFSHWDIGFVHQNGCVPFCARPGSAPEMVEMAVGGHYGNW